MILNRLITNVFIATVINLFTVSFSFAFNVYTIVIVFTLASLAILIQACYIIVESLSCMYDNKRYGVRIFRSKGIPLNYDHVVLLRSIQLLSTDLINLFLFRALFIFIDYRRPT